MRIRYIVLALASAVCLLLGLHPLDLYGFAWLGFVPIFSIVFDPKVRMLELVICSLIASILYHSVHLYWLLQYQVQVYIAVLLILSSIFVIYFFLLKLLTVKIQAIYFRIVIAIFLWIALVKIEGLTSIGTLGTDMPFYGPLPFLQIASIAGFVGLQAILIGFNAALALLVKKRTVPTIFFAFFFASVLLGVYFWGYARLNEKEGLKGKEIRVALVQHNLPMDPNWRLKHPGEIKLRYEKLAEEAGNGNPNLIVFPLYTISEDIYRSPEFFSQLAVKMKTYILTASHIPRNSGASTFSQNFIDMAILYSPEGKIIAKYEAVKAPPFRGKFEQIEEQYEILKTPFGKFGILLCYEDTRPEVTKEALKAGAGILIVMTNPGFFSNTYVPYYHLIQDQIRAIEAKRWLGRIVASGYSAFIDSRGRLLQRSHLNREEILNRDVFIFNS